MEVACPSCGALFEADEAEAALPGVPVCDSCRLRAEADIPKRGRRPKAPELSLDSAEVRLSEVDVPVDLGGLGDDSMGPSSDGEVVSARDVELISNPGLERTRPLSVSGLEAGFSPGDREGDPVSLRDLEFVLSPGAAPPPWTGGSGGSGGTEGEPRAPRPGQRPAFPGIEGSFAPRAAVHAAPAPPQPPTIDRPPLDLGEAVALAAADPLPAVAKAAVVKAVAAPKVAAPKPAPQKAAPAKTRAERDPPMFKLDSDPPPPPRDDEPEDVPTSGLLDIRSLAESVAHDAKREERRSDFDLFNLSGGIFNESARPLNPVDLSLLISPVADLPPESSRRIAPVLDADALRSLSSSRPPPAPSSAPVVSERRTSAAATAAAKRSGLANRAVMIAGVGAIVVAAFWFGRGTRPAADPTPAKADAVPTQVAEVLAPSPTQVAPPRGETTAAGTVTPSPTATAVTPGAPVVHATVTPVAVRPPGGGDPSRPPPDLPPAPRPTAAPTPAPAPTPVAPAPPPGGGAEFDRNAARAALAAAASAASGCKAADDPTGGAKVQVTFAASGRVTTARVVGPPFQGTKTGGCIASAFRGATVPPFEGAPVTVSKDVNIR